MKSTAFKNLSLLSVEESSSMPKYMQIVNIILSDIDNGIFKRGEMIPSINETSSEFYISRDTVEKAYKKLKEMGAVCSVRGKGYFVASSSKGQSMKILLISEYLGSETKYLYELLKTTLNKFEETEVFIHAGNPDFLCKSIQTHIGLYDYYVLLSNPECHSDKMKEALELIPSSKLIYIQKSIISSREVAASFEYDESQLRKQLESMFEVFYRYDKIYMGTPEKVFFNPLYIGILNFFFDNKIKVEILPDLDALEVNKGELFIPGCDEELYAILNKCSSNNFIPGREVGVIGLTNSPLIEFIGGGITVLCTDFNQICRGVISVIRGEIKETVGVGYKFVRRASA
jgi:DNA-binding transcriptional regulator YhcF (GntR family)